MSFEQFGLPAALLRAVQEIGYSVPTPIQTAAIPAVHAGRDLLAAAQEVDKLGLLLGAGFAMLWRPAAILRGPLREKAKVRKREAVADAALPLEAPATAPARSRRAP